MIYRNWKVMRLWIYRRATTILSCTNCNRIPLRSCCPIILLEASKTSLAVISRCLFFFKTSKTNSRASCTAYSLRLIKYLFNSMYLLHIIIASFAGINKLAITKILAKLCQTTFCQKQFSLYVEFRLSFIATRSKFIATSLASRLARMARISQKTPNHMCSLAVFRA